MGRGFDSRRERQIYMQKILATSVKVGDCAVLIQGKSGAGKTFLAMRLVANHGACLVSDDVTCVQEQDGVLYAETVPEIAGLVEIRGVGVVQTPHVGHIPVACIVNLVEHSADRCPSEQTETIAEVQIPLFTFDTNFAYNDLQVIAALNYLKQKGSIC